MVQYKQYGVKTNRMVIGTKQTVCGDKQLTLRLNETVLENVTVTKCYYR